ncbi:hypothetical protein RI367_003285 [Sorochytrium milnesiophthora]
MLRTVAASLPAALRRSALVCPRRLVSQHAAPTGQSRKASSAATTLDMNAAWSVPPNTGKTAVPQAASSAAEQETPSLLDTLRLRLSNSIPASAYHHNSVASVSVRYFSAAHHQLYSRVEQHQATVQTCLTQLQASSLSSERLLNDAEFMYKLEACVRAVAYLYRPADYAREGRFHDVLYGWPSGVSDADKRAGLVYTLTRVVRRIEKSKELINDDMWKQFCQGR